MCIIISVRKTCTISCLALDVTTPVEIALFTVPEKKLFSGILKERCQFPAGCWLGITANSVSSSLEWEESCV